MTNGTGIWLSIKASGPKVHHCAPGRRLLGCTRSLWPVDLIPHRWIVRRNGIRITDVWLSIMLLFCSAAARAGEGRFSATLDRDSIVLGEVVTLSCRFENGQPGGLPGIPTVAGLQVAGTVSTSTESRIEGGAMTATTTYSIPLAPQHAGEFVIPPITAQVDGQNAQSQP